MSVAVAQSGSSSMFGSHQPHHHHRRVGSDSGISRTSWIDDNQPIPWSGDSSSEPLGGSSEPSGSSSTSAVAAAARPTPPAVLVWRQSGQHLAASNIVDVPQGLASGSHSRSASLVSMGMGGTLPSRSRVSMDALPGDADDYDCDHRTITPSSSTASLPTMMFGEIRSPHPHVAIPPPRSGPVGLCLTAVLDNGEEWPPRDEEVDSDSDELVDQQEMDNYMASHRAPVDATLRSMPGVVGLGDGWAGGPQTKPKRRWFRRGKKEEAPAAADPLALWAMPDTPTTVAAPTTPTASEGPSNGSPPDDAAKRGGKWKSRKNLFSASQRVLPTAIASPEAGTLPDRSDRAHSSTPTKAPPSAGGAKAGRGLLSRSRLNFGSMVDLRRSNESSSPDSPYKQPAGKRHSVAGFLRKAPPHPLELSHGNGSTAASKSQPVGLGLSAYSSQPSLVSPTPLSHHPILRQAYARSESHLAGAGVSPGNAPRPAPLIINSGVFVNTAPMPLWRPPVMSPTPLLEVEEEDEEEHELVPELTDRPALKRSATFGDDEETPRTLAQKKSTALAAPELSPVHGSPVEAQRALSMSTGYSRGTSRAETVSPQPPPSFLGRIKSALNLGGRAKSTKASSVRSSPMIPESPRSFQSEIPSTPQRQSLAPQPRSVGRGLRPRSRLFSRRARDEVTPVPLVVTPETPNKQLPASLERANPGARRRVTRHVVESMVNFPSLRQNDLFSDDDDEPFASVRSRRRSLRTSWAAPLPDNMVDPEEEDDEAPRLDKRWSRMSLNRFKLQPKPRPALGNVFPRPPTEMQQPPSLHWAFPGSYSTPMLHKFGGSTLSLALDISAETPATTGSSIGNGLGGISRGLGGLEDIAESPTQSQYQRDKSVSPPPRERALSATIAALTARQSGSGKVRIGNVRRRTVPVNIDNLNSSTDSLTLPSCSIVDFPLPPSSSSGDISSPDPDTVEQLYTPRDARTYGKLHGEYYRRHGANDSGDSSEESATTGSSSLQRVLHKQPSWSTCVTSTPSAQETIQDMSPLVTPTSATSKEAALAAAAGDAGGYVSYNSSLLENDGEQHATYTSKRVSIAAPIVV